MEGGTKRDFGNMLLEHRAKPKKKKEAKFSPWTKIGKKRTESDYGN